MDLGSIPFVDNHAHPLTRKQPVDPVQFRSHFTEAHSPLLARDHVASAVYYRWTLRQLGGALQCEPNEEAVLRQRNERTFDAYAGWLCRSANIGALLLDEGYPPSVEAYSASEVRTLTGVRVERMLRMETLAEELIVRHSAWAAVVGAFDDVVSRARACGYVALKSIAAYRTGLRIEVVENRSAERAFHALRHDYAATGMLRLSSKPVIDFLVWRAMGHAAAQSMPVQFHTGYGDPDLDLRLANPLHLRPLFEERAFQAAPIVLLHESYPYTAEAGYLAAAYPNAYVDLAFSLPPLSRSAFRRVVETALAAAPATKVMCSSDGTSIPEHYWLGAIRARNALSDVLDAMVEGDELSHEDAVEIAHMILHQNATRIYGLA